MIHFVFASFRKVRRRWFLAFLPSLLTVLVCGRALLGQDAGPSVRAAREVLVAEMKQIAESLTAFEREGPERRPLKLRREPLLTWNDPIKEFSESSLWVWGDSGRPHAVLTLEF